MVFKIVFLKFLHAVAIFLLNEFTDRNMLILFQGSDDKNKVQEKMQKFAQRLSDDGEGGKPNYKGIYSGLFLSMYLPKKPLYSDQTFITLVRNVRVIENS